MKAVAPTTFARMSESLMSRKPLHKRLSRGFATRRSLPPIVEKNWRQKLPDGSPQGCEMPVAENVGTVEPVSWTQVYPQGRTRPGEKRSHRDSKILRCADGLQLPTGEPGSALPPASESPRLATGGSTSLGS